LTSQGRELSRQTTRATPKVKEAVPMCSISKGKGKVMVVEEACEELQQEELERLLAKKAAIQEMIDNLQK
jgi:ribosomal protein S9